MQHFRLIRLRVVVAFVALTLPSPSSNCGEAVFSADSTRVFIAGEAKGEVSAIDLGLRTKTNVVIPGLDGEKVLGLERCGSGILVVQTETGLHGWDGAEDVRLATGPRFDDGELVVDRAQPGYWKDRVYSLPFSRNPFVQIDYLGKIRVYWIGFADQWEEAPARAAELYSAVIRNGWEAADRLAEVVDEPWGQLEVACNPVRDQIVCHRFDLESGSSVLSIWDPSRGRMLPVSKPTSMRIRGARFDSEGALYFGADGDLWYGLIRSDELKGQLTAYRVAPLATLASSAGTSSQMGVTSVAAASEYLYIHLARLGGSGWGKIVRIARTTQSLDPQRAAMEADYPIDYDLGSRIGAYRMALESFEELGDTSGMARLAASPDGRLVYYQANGIDYLVRDHGKPEQLALVSGE